MEMALAHKVDKYRRITGAEERPKTLQEFIDRANAYFEYCEQNGMALTITGLALAVGFTSRVRLWEKKFDKEWGPTVERALTIIENGYERRLEFGSCAGAIFALKNMGWADKQDWTISVDQQDPLKLNTAPSAALTMHQEMLEKMKQPAIALPEGSSDAEQ